MSDTIASDDKTQIGTVNPATGTTVNRRDVYTKPVSVSAMNF